MSGDTRRNDTRQHEDATGFSDAEKAAMKQRAAELRAQGGKGAAKKEREAQACLDAIAELTGTDQVVARRLHVIVTEEAPELDHKTWYGFPSYARDGKVIVYYQPASKFDTRYGMVSFSQDAQLDDGVVWPVSFAVLEVTEDVDQRLRELVRRAAG